jgi:hypothetical protein
MKRVFQLLKVTFYIRSVSFFRIGISLSGTMASIPSTIGNTSTCATISAKSKSSSQSWRSSLLLDAQHCYPTHSADKAQLLLRTESMRHYISTVFCDIDNLTRDNLLTVFQQSHNCGLSIKFSDKLHLEFVHIRLDPGWNLPGGLHACMLCCRGCTWGDALCLKARICSFLFTMMRAALIQRVFFSNQYIILLLLYMSFSTL